ncbi:MAG TPA: hypothetical protein VFT95_06855, partial [Micromonosporaceae bacterium]|nr:hypothetical protein [Micromonosporaceae bacterium]
MSLRRRLALAVSAACAVSAGSLVLAAPAPAAGAPASSAAQPAVRLIVDTDFGQWWDDVAALAMVHAAADAGRVRLLGVMSDVDNPWNAPAL